MSEKLTTPGSMEIADRLEHCAKYTGLDAVRELLQEAAQAMRKRDAVIKLLEGEAGQARAQAQGEPFAWVEHHKGGDNLVWDEPGGRKSPLYTTPHPSTAPNLTCTSVQARLAAQWGYVRPAAVPMTDGAVESAKRTPREIARSLKESGMACNCDFDRWEPEKATGHSHVCRIHKAAMSAHHGITAQAKKETP